MLNNYVEPKDLVRLFQRIYGQQSPDRPLSSTSLYIIHSRRYVKPYKPDVKESIDAYKTYILRQVDKGEINSRNTFDRNHIIQLIQQYTRYNYCDELAENDYCSAFEELIEENENIYSLCMQTLKDNKEHYSELLKDVWW